MQPRDGVRRRLMTPAMALLVILLVGTGGYYHLGDGRWSPGECFYMTVITLTTVGFGEVLEGMEAVAWARAFTTILIICGMGVVVYFVSHLTAIIIEGELQRALRKTRMRTNISKLEGHVVVCGAGTTGRHVVAELVAAGQPCVAIDVDESLLERRAEEWRKRRFYYLAGDATDDLTLTAANVAHAAGLVASLPNDKDNLYVVVSARQLNPNLRVVARGSDLTMLEKLRKAGADSVVSPNFIGGMRMVSELIRPQVVRFLDEMLRDRKSSWRIEEVKVLPGSPFVGRTLADVDLRRRYDVAVLAARDSAGRSHYNPGGGFEVEDDMTLVVLGQLDRVADLRRHAAN